MFEICFLGTMSGVPSADRALNSTLILHEGKKYLIDCGEGVQQRILQSGLGLSGLTDVFITHGHVDHFIGLAGLLLALETFNQRTKLCIHADSKTLPLLQKLISLCDLRGPAFHEWAEINEGTLLTHKNLIVRAFPLQHSVTCHGLIFEEPEKRKFSVKQAEALGVAKKLWGRLQRGETVAVNENKKVTPDDVLEPPVRGCFISYIADTIFFDELIGYCQNSSCLICEATYLDVDKNFATKHRHMTAKQTGGLARKAQVKGLVANHLSNRYQPAKIGSELRQYFSKAVIPKDLEMAKVTDTGIKMFNR